MFSKFIIAIVGFILIACALGAVKVAQLKEMSAISHVPPATAVTTIEAQSVAWHPVLQAIGTLAPVDGITLSADAEGTIVKIFVESGAVVKAGDPLVQLDTSVEVAQLNAAEARADLARINIDRARELLNSKTLAKSEFDGIEASTKQTLADVAALRAQIDKKLVRAPFDGRIGIRLVNIGQYISKGRALMPLQKLNPIYADFSVPQRQLSDLTIGQKVSVSVDAYHGRVFEGTITAINSEVDASTRNISVQATLPNPEELLRAGMFTQVLIELPVGPAQVVLPSTAVAYAPYGNSVFIVETMKDKEGKDYTGVRQQVVKLGATKGDMVTVESGVKPGEQVVTAGVFKLRNGAHIQVNNTVQPSAESAPKPANT